MRMSDQSEKRVDGYLPDLHPAQIRKRAEGPSRESRHRQTQLKSVHVF